MDVEYTAGTEDAQADTLASRRYRYRYQRSTRHYNTNDHECLSHHGTNAYAERNSCSCRFCRAAVLEYVRQTVRIRQALAAGG